MAHRGKDEGAQLSDWFGTRLIAEVNIRSSIYIRRPIIKGTLLSLVRTQTLRERVTCTKVSHIQMLLRLDANGWCQASTLDGMQGLAANLQRLAMIWPGGMSGLTFQTRSSRIPCCNTSKPLYSCFPYSNVRLLVMPRWSLDSACFPYSPWLWTCLKISLRTRYVHRIVLDLLMNLWFPYTSV